MKKIVTLMAMIIIFCILLTGCDYGYNRAIIIMQDGTHIEGAIEKCGTYSGGNVMVRINGVSYYTSSENVLLIAD